MASARPNRIALRNPRRAVAERSASVASVSVAKEAERDVVAYDNELGAELHPAVYRIVLACAAVFLLASWGAFGGGRMNLLFAPVTLIFAVMAAIPMTIRLVGPRVRLAPQALRDFLAGRVDTASGPLAGRQALMQIALVPVCLAFAAIALALISRSVGA